MPATVTSWHPIQNAVEIEPTVFELRDQYNQPYAIVRLVTVADGRKAWRAVTWANRSEDRSLIGYSWQLMGAVRAAHLAWVRTVGSPPEPEYPNLHGAAHR